VVVLSSLGAKVGSLGTGGLACRLRPNFGCNDKEISVSKYLRSILFLPTHSFPFPIVAKLERVCGIDLPKYTTWT
jgi:hypothetical protein